VTKEEIKDVVVLHTNRDDKTDLIYTAIDLGLKQINMRWPFKQTRIVVDTAVVEDQVSISLPTDALQLVSVRIKDDGTVTGAQVVNVYSKSYLVQNFPALGDEDTSSSGKPTIAYEQNGQLFFVPRSNGSYTLELTYDSIELLEETTDSPASANLDEALIAYATAYVYKSIQMLSDAQFWNVEYERAFDITRRADSSRTAQKRGMRGAQQHGQPRPGMQDYRLNDFTRT